MMKINKNKALLSITKIALVVAVLSALFADSESIIPLCTEAVSMTWILLFCCANVDTYTFDLEDNYNE